MKIRPAVTDDAEQACDVLRRSITELCEADHHNDHQILTGWLANKTPENIRAWINAKDGQVFVACEESTILAVAAVKDSGMITLNYVAPEGRFKGISKAMLATLEQYLRDRNINTCVLSSTETARKFYEARNFVAAEETKIGATGLKSYPMSKSL